MIAHELVKMSREAGYTVGTRGCSGASLVSFLMGITETNPLPPHYICRKCEYADFAVSGIKGHQIGDIGAGLPDRKCPICGKKMRKDGFDIPVATFLGINLDKEPDFDFNFSGEYQREIQQKVVEIDGVGAICRAGTIGTLSETTAMKYARSYFQDKKSKRKTESIVVIARKLVGVKRNDGVHPGGIIPLPQYMDEDKDKYKDAYRYTPFLPGIYDSIPRTQMDYHALDSRLYNAQAYLQIHR